MSQFVVFDQPHGHGKTYVNPALVTHVTERSNHRECYVHFDKENSITVEGAIDEVVERLRRSDPTLEPTAWSR